jgi:hypothetical protein
MGAMFYGPILSTAWKKGMVLSKDRPLLAFSEEMPSSFQTFGEKHPLGQQSSRRWKLSCGVLPPPGAALSDT